MSLGQDQKWFLKGHLLSDWRVVIETLEGWPGQSSYTVRAARIDIGSQDGAMLFRAYLATIAGPGDRYLASLGCCWTDIGERERGRERRKQFRYCSAEGRSVRRRSVHSHHGCILVALPASGVYELLPFWETAEILGSFPISDSMQR